MRAFSCGSGMDSQHFAPRAPRSSTCLVAPDGWFCLVRPRPGPSRRRFASTRTHPVLPPDLRTGPRLAREGPVRAPNPWVARPIAHACGILVMPWRSKSTSLAPPAGFPQAPTNCASASMGLPTASISAQSPALEGAVAACLVMGPRAASANRKVGGKRRVREASSGLPVLHDAYGRRGLRPHRRRPRRLGQPRPIWKSTEARRRNPLSHPSALSSTGSPGRASWPMCRRGPRSRVPPDRRSAIPPRML